MYSVERLDDVRRDSLLESIRPFEKARYGDLRVEIRRSSGTIPLPVARPALHTIQPLNILRKHRGILTEIAWLPAILSTQILARPASEAAFEILANPGKLYREFLQGR